MPDALAECPRCCPPAQGKAVRPVAAGLEPGAGECQVGGELCALLGLTMGGQGPQVVHLRKGLTATPETPRNHPTTTPAPAQNIRNLLEQAPDESSRGVTEGSEWAVKDTTAACLLISGDLACVSLWDPRVVMLFSPLFFSFLSSLSYRYFQ